MTSRAFEDNVVIITGASLGLGAELARQLADQGAWLALAARSADRLEAVADECRARGGRAIVAPTDVTDQAQCRALIERTVAEYGRIDTLINNAGMGMWARFEELQHLDVMQQLMWVNYLGSVYCTSYALPYLRQTRGRLAAISSLAGKTGVPAHSGYVASKHALTGFFDTLRIELQGSGVSVTVIFPGFVATGIHERNIGPDGRLLGQSHTVDYRRAMPTETCARIVIRATARRRRQVVMTLRGKVGQWLRLIAPGLVDAMARRAVERGR